MNPWDQLGCSYPVCSLRGGKVTPCGGSGERRLEVSRWALVPLPSRSSHQGALPERLIVREPGTRRQRRVARVPVQKILDEVQGFEQVEDVRMRTEQIPNEGRPRAIFGVEKNSLRAASGGLLVGIRCTHVKVSCQVVVKVRCAAVRVKVRGVRVKVRCSAIKVKVVRYRRPLAGHGEGLKEVRMLRLWVAALRRSLCGFVERERGRERESKRGRGEREGG